MTFVICSAAVENALAPVSRLVHSKVIWPCAGRCITMLNHDRRSFNRIITALLLLFCLHTGCQSAPCSGSSDQYREAQFSQDGRVLLARFYPPQSMTIEMVRTMIEPVGAFLSCIDPASSVGTAGTMALSCYFVKFPAETCFGDAQRKMLNLHPDGNMSILLPLTDAPCDCNAYWPLVSSR